MRVVSAKEAKDIDLTPKDRGRNVFLDHAKAIAIILMVLLHTTSRYVVLTNVVEAFHMAIFFLIGGVFFKSADSFRSVLCKGFRQLIIPYLVFSIIALTICWISPYIHPELYPGLDTFPKIIKAAVIGIFLAPNYYTGFAFLPLGPLWFLLALFWCRLLFYYWTSSKKYIWLYRIAICIIIGLILYFRLDFLSLTGMAVSFPFFALGYYIRKFILQLPLKSWRYRILLLCVSALVLLYFDDGVAFAAGKVLGNVLIAYSRGVAGCIVLLIICTISVRIHYISEKLSILGLSTLAVLGLHFHFIYLAKALYARFFGNIGDIHILYALITSIVTVIIITHLNNFFAIKAPYIIGKTK